MPTENEGVFRKIKNEEQDCNILWTNHCRHLSVFSIGVVSALKCGFINIFLNEYINVF